MAIVPVSDSLDRPFARHADVMVPAWRARGRRVAPHGATLLALEAIILGLAAADGQRALAAQDRLNDLPAKITGNRHDAG